MAKKKTSKQIEREHQLKLLKNRVKRLEEQGYKVGDLKLSNKGAKQISELRGNKLKQYATKEETPQTKELGYDLTEYLGEEDTSPNVTSVFEMVENKIMQLAPSESKPIYSEKYEKMVKAIGIDIALLNIFYDAMAKFDEKELAEYYIVNQQMISDALTEIIRPSTEAEVTFNIREAARVIYMGQMLSNSQLDMVNEVYETMW